MQLSEATRETAAPSSSDFRTVTLRAAQTAGAVTGYLQKNDVQHMLADAARLVRSYPEQSLVAAAAFGLLLGAAIRRS